MRRLRGFDLTKTSYGWVCMTAFTVETSRQFTPEEHRVRTHSRYFLLAVLWGLFLAWRTANRRKAKPGEREALGWK